ncbi:hypothetical protein [Streptomyces tauricus]|uniref:hypothetical protein n=1 Tax=Streptomyces tauricus TaxID=68274 RepID=UPI0033A94502
MAPPPSQGASLSAAVAHRLGLEVSETPGPHDEAGRIQTARLRGNEVPGGEDATAWLSDSSSASRDGIQHHVLYGIVRPDKKKAQFMPVLADELISRQVAKVAKVDIALTAASWSGFQAGSERGKAVGSIPNCLSYAARCQWWRLVSGTTWSTARSADRARCSGRS